MLKQTEPYKTIKHALYGVFFCFVGIITKDSQYRYSANIGINATLLLLLQNMPEETTTLESALGTANLLLEPKVYKVEKTFLERRMEEENKPIPTEIPDWLISDEEQTNTQPIENQDTLEDEQQEKVQELQTEAKQDLDEGKKEIKEAIATWDESFLNEVIRKMMDDRERLTYRNIELESQVEIINERLKQQQKEIYWFKYDDERLPVHEKSRAFYLAEYDFFNNPDDTNKKERYVNRLKERLEQATGKDLSNFETWSSSQNIKSISALWQSKSTTASMVEPTVPQPIRWYKVKRTYY